MHKDVLKMKAVEKYKEIAFRMIQKSYPNLLPYEIDMAINDSICNRINGVQKATIHNSYKDIRLETTILELTEYIEKRQPIMTAYGVLFKKHGEVPNPLAKLLQTFMENRDIHKSEMFKYPKGSEMFEKYNLLQQLDKIDANGSFGAIGQNSCLFYNLYVAASITAQGRSYISAAGLFFEMFLDNNVKFGSLNEVITFIDNVCSEKNERHYNDKDILDRDITVAECFNKIMMTCGFNYVPSDEDLNIVWDILCNTSQEDINRLFYKNNLYTFMENKSMERAIIYLLKSLKSPYVDPSVKDKAIPPEIKVELDEFYELLKEYVYYHYQIIDRLDKYANMIRSVCVITDTDSTIISLDAWYRFVLDKVKDIPMNIKKQKINLIDRLEIDDFNDIELHKAIERIELKTDYDFYNDEMIEMEARLNPCVIIPQEGLRYSIINIMAHCLSRFILDYMERYTKNSNSYSKDKKCMVIMKNEFLFKRLLLIGVKKFYASIQELQEGHIINGGMLDIKGLPMVKKTLNKKSRKRLKEILFEEILNKDDIDQIQIIKEIAKFENEVFKSLQSGSKEFYKPVAVKSFSNYPNPMGQQGIKGAVVWNELRKCNPDSMPLIDLEERNSLDVLKVVIDRKTIEEEKDKLDESIYNKLKEIMEMEYFKGVITAISVPRDAERIPEWMTLFINYEAIISDNCRYLPIGSIGLYRGNINNNYTNILKL